MTYSMVTIINTELHIWKLKGSGYQKNNYVWWRMSTSIIVVLISQYTQLLNHYVVYLKLLHVNYSSI